MAEPIHLPVMVAEVVRAVEPQGRRVLDVTVGLGGHAAALLDAGAALVIGLDRDPEALHLAARRLEAFGDRFEPVRGTFRDLARVVGARRIDAVIADLGVSSLQLDHAQRGFSFRLAGPLDMRMDPEAPTSAASLLASLDEDGLTELLRRGEVGPLARRYARAILAAMPTTTEQLAEVVVEATPPSRRTTRRHPATLVFQALRLAVNDELGQLTALLPAAFEALEVGGVLAVLTYHSLEDRLVKRFFEVAERGGAPRTTPAGSWTSVLERRPRRGVVPSDDEVARNPRARSARLRVARKLAVADLAPAWEREVHEWLALR
ncbi:S-adenosyl-methyltransferase MraW [Acidimicrobium ferrooxidans DSM 10331]|uniref:Ribosomal RNA small subunit methyltransferase H n=1 Tax=Acidimicrobium ferrooxidans (strain DSM 10331 / JCM 15462 / NBRC 103882 / ICP) TaxID=525909 RepID=C7LZM5_ACIFD|nr:16S rRNA (cytosine(1402)-N(4))-methyltransferase RsmH [Acidimicrobium ferrooxidans]ACU54183.1 S-adenosyl-methyltransferase MraW [Acidimicrobium ferrooxidans DSM 10331]